MATPKPKVLELVTDTEAEVEREHLFSVDGVKYYARTEVPWSVTLRANRIFVEQGEQAANAYCVQAVIGEEGWLALENFDQLTQEQFEGIVEYAELVVKGPGKANRAARRAGTRPKR